MSTRDTDETRRTASERHPTADAGQSDTTDGESQEPPAEAESLGWRGWVLVGALLVSMVVIPWTIIYLPAAQDTLGSVGLGWRDAYLVLPLIPALGLGVLAVWAAVASRRSGE